MPAPGTPLDQLGFLTIGTFDPADPGPGHEATLAMVELGEQLGFDSAWLRHRHLQPGISSPVAVLAALTQRTRRIRLGTAVTPLAWENPLRLAEDLGTVDVLSGGRLNPGVSVGPPMHWDDVKAALYPDTADVEDLTYTRVERLLGLLRGEPASTFSGVDGIESFSDFVQPHSPGLRAVRQELDAAVTQAQRPQVAMQLAQIGAHRLGIVDPNEDRLALSSHLDAQGAVTQADLVRRGAQRGAAQG